MSRLRQNPECWGPWTLETLKFYILENHHRASHVHTSFDDRHWPIFHATERCLFLPECESTEHLLHVLSSVCRYRFALASVLLLLLLLYAVVIPVVWAKCWSHMYCCWPRLWHDCFEFLTIYCHDVLLWMVQWFLAKVNIKTVCCWLRLLTSCSMHVYGRGGGGRGVLILFCKHGNVLG